MKSKFLVLVSFWVLMFCMALARPAPAGLSDEASSDPYAINCFTYTGADTESDYGIYTYMVSAQIGLNAPTNVQAAPGNLQAAVSFNVADSYDAATSFTVTGAGTDNSAPTAAGAGSPIVVTGLTNGVSYTFTVTATDAYKNTSPASLASNSVIPAAGLFAAWAGTWNLNFIYAGADAPYWIRCSEQLDENGTSTSSCNDNNGDTLPTSTGANFLFPYGMVPIIPGSPFPNMVCYGSMGNTFITCMATLADGTTVLSTGSLQAASYSMSDIAGNWHFHYLDPGPNDPGWTEANATINSSGDYKTSSRNSNGKTSGGTGVLSLSSEGVVTCTSGGCANSLEAFMDKGLTTMAGTATQSGGDASIILFTKEASSYSLADLAGLWAGNQLSSDGTWKRMNLQINPDGTGTESGVYSDGTTDSGYGELVISPAGVVTCAANSSNCSDVNWVMDAGKTVMVGTGGLYYSMLIMTKAATLPGAPTDVTASASGAGQATVNFDAPASAGGSAITGYTVTSIPGGLPGTGTTSPITVNGLKNGTAYTFTVTATNAMGLTSASSKPSNKITTLAAPGKPTITSLTAGNAEVTVKFTEPISTTGGSISFTVTSTPGGLIGTGTASPITVGSLQ
ncbi:MAG: fibronectin type III domain-containing protein, partial [Syntrophobacteraceae bacterium]